MGMNEGENERYDMLANRDIRKVVPRLAASTIISMMVSSAYNMVDTFFVNQLDTSASGAMGIIFSAMAIIQAPSFTIGMGTGNHMARCLGAGRTKKGKTAVSVVFFTGMILGTCLGSMRLLHIDRIVILLGAIETIKSYVVEYTCYIFIATPFMVCPFVMNNLLRLQGLAAFAMIGTITGGTSNIALDPLFIFDLNLGTSGAIIVTELSQLISFCTLLTQCNRGKECTPIWLRNFRPSLSLYGKIIYGGTFSLARQGMASITTIVLNTTAHPFGGVAIATMAIVNRLVYFINSAVIGFGQGFQPVYAFSCGAKKYARVRQVYVFCVKFTICIPTAICAGVLPISGHVTSLFCRDDPVVIAIDTLALWLQFITMWFNGFLTVSSMVSQSIGYGFRATLLFISRQGLFLIPILLLAAHLLGLPGIQAAQPIADVRILVLTAFIIHGIFQSFPQEPQGVRDTQGFQGVWF